MSIDYIFEKAWQAKLSRCLDEIAGEEIRFKVMSGSEALTADSTQQEVVDWSQEAMARLDELVGEQDRIHIMTGCACQYPPEDLAEIRDAYRETGDVGIVLSMLQEKFEHFLRHVLKLEESMSSDIVSRGWGMAGVLQGNAVIATKIPKSGYLVQYMNETDPEKRRQMYCHCPRVRGGVQPDWPLSPTYCYCGAGFYRGIWETILQQQVEVEILSSVLQGDDVCAVKIHLPV